MCNHWCVAAYRPVILRKKKVRNSMDTWEGSKGKNVEILNEDRWKVLNNKGTQHYFVLSLRVCYFRAPYKSPQDGCSRVNNVLFAVSFTSFFFTSFLCLSLSLSLFRVSFLSDFGLVSLLFPFLVLVSFWSTWVEAFMCVRDRFVYFCLFFVSLDFFRISPHGNKLEEKSRSKRLAAEG